MAEIVKACDASLSARPLVAVKRILPHLCDDPQYRTMFMDESRVLSHLDHPNIIRAFEIGEVEGTPYIALDYVEGRDARELFQGARSRETQIPIAIGCYIVASLCDGLHHAHGQRDAQGEPLGLVHRDVSLQNLLLSYAGDVKLTDFGIAISAENEAHTEVGIVKGKFGYMSPEQIRGAPLDRRSDVFGAGICLYELLTCQRLFLGENDYKAIERVRNVDIDPPSVWNRSIGSDLERIVLKSLAKDPRDRYQTALELRHELVSCMAAASERCTRDDLASYLQQVFAEEYQGEQAGIEEDEGITAVHAGIELALVHAALSSRAEAAAVPVPSAVLDGTTGRPAFEHQERVGHVSLTSDPEHTGEAFRAVQRGPSMDEPAGLPASDFSPVTGVTPTGLRASAARAFVPVGDADPDGQLAEGAPAPIDARPPAIEWEERELSSASPGLEPVVQRLADALMADGRASRAAREQLEPFGPALESGSYPPRVPAAGSGWSNARAADLNDTGTAVAVPIPAAARVWSAVRRLDSAALVKLMGAMMGVMLLIIVALIVAQDRGPGTIRVITQPRDVTVRVDGQRAPGSASPFILSNLDSRNEHAISVDKPGYQGWSTRLKLRPDQVLDLPLIRLEPLASPPSAVEVAAPMAQAPAGVAAPAESAEVLRPPAEPMLAAGEDDAALRAAESGLTQASRRRGSSAEDKKRSGEGRGSHAAKDQHLRAAEPERAANDATGEREPSSADLERTTVRANKSARGTKGADAERGSGATDSERDASDTSAVRATHVVLAQPDAGAAQPERDPSPTKAGGDRSAVHVELDPSAVLAEPDTSAAHAQPARTEVTAQRGTPAADSERSAAEAAAELRASEAAAERPAGEGQPSASRPSAAVGSSGGILRVNTRPWTRVSVDGRVVGNTPQLNISVAAGTHSLSLINPEFGIDRTFTVQVKPGEIVTRVLDLRAQ